MFFGQNRKSKKKVIVVDDEPSFLNIFGELLKIYGFEVKGISDPKKALLEIPVEKPDLVLLDISMPELDGFQVFEHLKNDLKEEMPKVVFLTSLGETISGQKVDEHFAKDIGADGYIRKTADLKQISEQIQDLIKNL